VRCVGNGVVVGIANFFGRAVLQLIRMACRSEAFKRCWIAFGVGRPVATHLVKDDDGVFDDTLQALR
jgi:hypothetical protein